MGGITRATPPSFVARRLTERLTTDEYALICALAALANLLRAHGQGHVADMVWDAADDALSRVLVGVRRTP